VKRTDRSSEVTHRLARILDADQAALASLGDVATSPDVSRSLLILLFEADRLRTATYPLVVGVQCAG